MENKTEEKQINWTARRAHTRSALKTLPFSAMQERFFFFLIFR